MSIVRNVVRPVIRSMVRSVVTVFPNSWLSPVTGKIISEGILYADQEIIG